MFAILRRSFPRLSSPHRRQSHAIRDPMANGVSGFAADRAVCSVSLALEFASVPARVWVVFPTR